MQTRSDMVVAGLALLASIALVQIVAGEPALTVSFAAGAIVLGVVAHALLRERTAPRHAGEDAVPDWTVTRSAIEHPDRAVAITDRANRLVCANSAYETSFGTDAGPTRLALPDGGADTLSRIARLAWREGSAGEPNAISGASGAWSVEARRAGAADEFMLWEFEPLRLPDRSTEAREFLTGPLGRMLGDAGIAAALVRPDGSIAACNPALSRAAGADAKAAIEGREMAQLFEPAGEGRLRVASTGAGTGAGMGAGGLAGEGDPGAEGATFVPLEVPLATDLPGDATDRLFILLDEDVLPRDRGGSPAEDAQGAQLERLIDRLPMGLAGADRDGRFLYANAAFLRAAGVSEKGLPPFPSDLVARSDKTAMADAVRRFAHGGIAAGDIAVRLAGGGSEEPVSIGLTGVRGPGRLAVLLSLADSSEENRLKRQVAQATKMQAVGQLAGGVAHDFNNVLTAIIGYCDLMLLRHSPGDSDYDDIQQIRANSNRAASLTRQLLAFSRQQTLKPEVIQLPDVLSEVTQLLRRLLGARITLKVHHDRDLGPVRADPRQLEQVIINLAVNARDAIQERGGGEQATGTLSFFTRSTGPEDIRRLDSEIIPPGDYTLLVAEDTGGGIPRRVLGKIFEPFFTTKEQGKGTGLGLSTVYGIVKQSGGFIFADNARNGDGSIRGARFTVYLPVHAGAAYAGAGHSAEADAEEGRAGAGAERRTQEPAREWSGGGRILLVEDEDMVRAVAQRSLARQGYEVVTARDGEEGLEAFAAGEFDLVVSDVVMPGTDGPTMARAIREKSAAVPILFMSGYAEGQLHDEIEIAAMHFIAKPFSVRQIADKVAAILAG